MTLTELQAAVGNRCGVASTDSRYSTIPDRINEALHAIETYAGGEWDWLIKEGTVSTVADQDYLAFSTLATALTADGVRRIRWVECANGSGGYEPCKRASKAQLRSHFAGFAATSVVVAWAAQNQRLWLFPTPSTVLTLRFEAITTEPDLSSGSDEPLLPVIYHRVLVSAASALVLRSLQRYDEAKVEEEAAAQGMSRMPGASMAYSGPGMVRRDGRY